jgi:BMFP domain-containing protein YqiC
MALIHELREEIKTLKQKIVSLEAKFTVGQPRRGYGTDGLKM